MASSIPGGKASGDGGLGTAGEGDTSVPGDKSGEEAAGEGSGSCSLLYCRLPNFGIQGDEDSPLVLLKRQENRHQQSPSHAFPGLTVQLLGAVGQEPRTQPEGYGQPAAGVQARALGTHLPRAHTRDWGQDGPAETSQLCGAGWQPAPQLPPLPRPATLPAGPASCPCRNAPAGCGSDTCLLPDGQAAACCRLLKPGMPGPCRGGCHPPSLLCREEVSPAPCTGGWDAPASSLSHQGKAAR